MTNCVSGGFIGVVLVDADSGDHWSSLWWEWQPLIFFYFLSLPLFINYSHLHLMCRSPSPLDMGPSSSKAALLGSVRATPGVAGPRTPAERWVLRAWACLDQGLNFPLKMRKRFMARSHESVSCSLKLLSWWLLLSWERIILSPPVPFFLFFFFVFISLPLSLNSGFVRISPQIFLLLRPCSFTPLISYFPLSEYAHSSFHRHPPLSLPLCCTPLSFFFFSISSILPFQHMTDCVINEHHKPLFLLATH